MVLLRILRAFTFRICLTCLLDKYLPSRTKRLIFISSLSACMRGIDKFDIEMMHKLNKLMNLCSSESAMKLPISLSKVIWRGMTSNEIFNIDLNSGVLDVSVIDQMAKHAVTKMPVWLRYADTITVLDDVKQMIASCNKMQTK